MFALVQCYTPDMTHFYLCGRIYYTEIFFTISLLFARRGIHLVQLVKVIIWDRIKLRINITCVFRSCINCPRRWITQAISTRNLAVIGQWRCLNKPESPFYLAVHHNRLSNEDVWYMKAPLRLESLSPWKRRMLGFSLKGKG